MLNVNSILFYKIKTRGGDWTGSLYTSYLKLAHHCSCYELERLCNKIDPLCCIERQMFGKSEAPKITFTFTWTTWLITFSNEFKKAVVRICLRLYVRIYCLQIQTLAFLSRNGKLVPPALPCKVRFWPGTRERVPTPALYTMDKTVHGQWRF